MASHTCWACSATRCRYIQQHLYQKWLRSVWQAYLSVSRIPTRWKYKGRTDISLYRTRSSLNHLDRIYYCYQSTGGNSIAVKMAWTWSKYRAWQKLLKKCFKSYTQCIQYSIEVCSMIWNADTLSKWYVIPLRIVLLLLWWVFIADFIILSTADTCTMMAQWWQAYRAQLK